MSDFPLPASDWLAAWLSDGMTCRAIQIYTRYGADVEGVSSY